MEEKWNYQREADGEGDPRSSEQHVWPCGEGEDSVVPRLGAGTQWRGWPSLLQGDTCTAGYGEEAEVRKDREASLGLFRGYVLGGTPDGAFIPFKTSWKKTSLYLHMT